MKVQRNTLTIYPQNDRTPANRTEQCVQDPQILPSIARRSQKTVDRRGNFHVSCEYRPGLESIQKSLAAFSGWKAVRALSIERPRTRPGFHLTNR